MIGALASHPIAQAFQTYAQQSGWGEHNNTGATRDANAQQTGVTTNDEENTFTPPLDIFSTPSSYVLHVAIPGAKKEDVGVNWDAEDFLRSLSKSERKVGVFERTIKLPMGDEKEEVDAEGISAKLEDGVLVVTVMKVEKEWTDVKKVDIM
jgi:HSP20 family protein